MILDIHLYGSDLLRRKTAEVADITPEIVKLAENMLETMYYHEGLGLAAPQVGVPLRLAVMDVPREGSGKLVLVNPVICELGARETMEEGCLSFPSIVVPVERAPDLTFEYMTLGGKKKVKRVTGVAAQAIQHEIDHLDGILLVDRMNHLRRAILAAKLVKLRRRGAAGGRR